MPQLPLSELRVVEIGSGDALGYCGKLFADFGAEIIKIEPPDGDAARKIAPLVDAGDGRHESGYFAWLNTNKRSVSADLNQSAGVQKVRSILASADLLLDARHPTEIKTSPLSHADIRRSQPGLAITTISWFGEHGPYRDYAVTDSVCRSLAGLVKLVGPIEGPPVLPRDGQIGVVAGLTAFIPTLAGLSACGGQGARRFAVSADEAMLQISEFDTAVALESGFTRPRMGINRFGRGFPVGNYATKISISVRWNACCRWWRRRSSNNPRPARPVRGSATGTRFMCPMVAFPASAKTSGSRLQYEATVSGNRFAASCIARTSPPIRRSRRRKDGARKKTASRSRSGTGPWTVRPDLAMVTLQAAGIAAGVARLPMDLPGDPHLMKVGHWQSVDRPFMGPHLLPSVAYREGDAELPYAIEHLAPTLGQHNEEILRDLLGLSDPEIERLRDDGVIGTIATSKKSNAALAAE
jgi:crotonobetainyl-CoA:carnitine CoA-transferase CaiB-like acyl-CoA transferase